MSASRDNKGDPKRPLIDTLVHLARRATGVPTSPLAREAVESAVRDFVLSPDGSRRVIAREIIAEAAAVIVADLVQDVGPAPASAAKSARKAATKMATKTAAPAARKTAAGKSARPASAARQTRSTLA